LTSREVSEAGLATAVVVVDVKNEILLWCGYKLLYVLFSLAPTVLRLERTS